MNLTPEQQAIAARLRKHLAQMEVNAPVETAGVAGLPAGQQDIMKRLMAHSRLMAPGAPEDEAKRAPVPAGVGGSGPAADPMADELERGDEASRRSALIAGLTRAGGMAGAAIGGTKLDTSAYDRMDRLADDPRNTAQLRVNRLEKMMATKRSMEEGRQRLASAEEERKHRRLMEGLGLKRQESLDEYNRNKDQRDYEQRERIARLTAGNAAAGRSERAEDKAEAVIERDVQKAGGDLADLPGMRNDLAVLNKFAAMEDVPGVGRWDSIKPDVFDSADDAESSQAAKRVAARLLKIQSGSAATEAEVSRLLESLGMGKGSTEEKFKIGLRSLIQNATDAAKQAEAKYRPEVLGTLRQRGGVTSREMPPPQAQEGMVRVSNGKETLEIPAADVADAEKDGFRRLP